MTLHSFILILISVSLSAGGQFAFKHGLNRLPAAPAQGLAESLAGFATSPFIYLGLALYGLGTVFWLLALRDMELSLAYPFVALSFILVFLLGIFGLGEPLTLAKVLGLGLITAGLIVLATA